MPPSGRSIWLFIFFVVELQPVPIAHQMDGFAYHIPLFNSQLGKCPVHALVSVRRDYMLWLDKVQQIPEVFPCSMAAYMDAFENADSIGVQFLLKPLPVLNVYRARYDIARKHDMVLLVKVKRNLFPGNLG